MNGSSMMVFRLFCIPSARSQQSSRLMFRFSRFTLLESGDLDSLFEFLILLELLEARRQQKQSGSWSDAGSPIARTPCDGGFVMQNTDRSLLSFSALRLAWGLHWNSCQNPG